MKSYICKGFNKKIIQNLSNYIIILINILIVINYMIKIIFLNYKYNTYLIEYIYIIFIFILII